MKLRIGESQVGSQGDKGISWTNETWNVVTGCTPVSEGCANCYAARYAKRGIGDFKVQCFPEEGALVRRKRLFSEVRRHPERLGKPLRWRKPRMVFVCSMGDLFHEAVPDSFIFSVFGVFGITGRHIFQVLTKRPERLYCMATQRSPLLPTQFINTWLGVTIESQKHEDRIRYLLQTPAAVRFVSLEPMLGEVDLDWILDGKHSKTRGSALYGTNKLDWVILGAESGPGARECKLDWVELVVDQCKAAGVPVHIKQLQIGGKLSKNPGDWPEHLRLREFPEYGGLAK